MERAWLPGADSADDPLEDSLELAAAFWAQMEQASLPANADAFFEECLPW